MNIWDLISIENEIARFFSFRVPIVTSSLVYGRIVWVNGNEKVRIQFRWDSIFASQSPTVWKRQGDPGTDAVPGLDRHGTEPSDGAAGYAPGQTRRVVPRAAAQRGRVRARPAGLRPSRRRPVHRSPPPGQRRGVLSSRHLPFSFVVGKQCEPDFLCIFRWSVSKNFPPQKVELKLNPATDLLPLCYQIRWLKLVKIIKLKMKKQYYLKVWTSIVIRIKYVTNLVVGSFTIQQITFDSIENIIVAVVRKVCAKKMSNVENRKRVVGIVH